MGVPKCTPGPSYLQGRFPGGSLGRPFADFSDFRASPGIPWGAFLRSKPLPVVPETGHTEKVRLGGVGGTESESGMGGDSLRNPGKDYDGKKSPRLAAGPWPGAAYLTASPSAAGPFWWLADLLT